MTKCKFLALLLGASAFATISHAEITGIYSVIEEPLSGKLEVHDGPGKKHALLGVLDKGERVEVTGFSEGLLWSRIIWEHFEDGWSYCQIWCLRIFGHAALWSSCVASIPSLNLTPATTLAR